MLSLHTECHIKILYDICVFWQIPYMKTMHAQHVPIDTICFYHLCLKYRYVVILHNYDMIFSK